MLYINSSSISNNSFWNNTARFAGGALRINGFNVSDILNPNLEGSCPYLQNKIRFESNNSFYNNNAPLHTSYTPQLGDLLLESDDILCSCIYGESLDSYPTNQANYCKKCTQHTYKTLNR